MRTFVLLLLGVAVQEPDAVRLQPPEISDHLVGLALREPMLVEHPSGALFAAGYSRAPEEFSDPPNLYMSRDGGANWVAVDVGTPEQGALGNSDVDLAIGPDGTLYFLTMGFDRSVGEGTHVAVGVSRDVGATWRWTFLSRDRFDDRPWIVVTPAGAAHVIWNDGQGVSHAVSADGGESWMARPRVHPRGGSSHLAVGPNGELAVRITPRSASGIRYDPGVDLIAVSTDGGETWTKRPAPGERDWEGGIPRWVEPLAWDGEGNLFSFWSDGSDLWLAGSADQGQEWDSLRLPLDTARPFYPFLTARGRGELAVSWFSEGASGLRAHVAHVDAGAREPVVRFSPPLEVRAWREGSSDPAGEYFPVMFRHGGGLAALLPIQNAPDGDGFRWLSFPDVPSPDWRGLEPENTLYLDLESGRVVIELAPWAAPRHVANVRSLARAGRFDGGAVVRSHDNYVAQWTVAPRDTTGERTSDATRENDEIASSLAPEFEAPVGDLPFTPIPDRDVYAPETGFTLGFPVGRDPETGTTWLAHCYGAVGVARGTDPASGSGASLYAVTGHSPRHLDRNLTMVGRVITGMEWLTTLPRGSGQLGFYAEGEEPEPILSARIGTELPAAERTGLQIMRTDSPAFRNHIESRRHRGEEFFVYPVDRIELCNVPVPVR